MCSPYGAKQKIWARKSPRPNLTDNDASFWLPNQPLSSCDLWPPYSVIMWPLTSWSTSLIYSCLVPWTICANLHKNQNICCQNLLFTSLVTDEWMNGQTRWEHQGCHAHGMSVKLAAGQQKIVWVVRLLCCNDVSTPHTRRRRRRTQNCSCYLFV